MIALLRSSKTSEIVLSTNMALRGSFLWVGWRFLQTCRSYGALRFLMLCFLQTSRSEGAFCGLVGVSYKHAAPRELFVGWSVFLQAWCSEEAFCVGVYCSTDVVLQ